MINSIRFQEGITVLVKCEEAANLLEEKIMEYRHEPEVQTVMKELVVMKARISKLLTQARQGLITIQVSKVNILSFNVFLETENYYPYD